jgi:hypothetical protein
MDPFDKWEDEVKLKDDEGSAELAIYQIENLYESILYTLIFLYHKTQTLYTSKFPLI